MTRTKQPPKAHLIYLDSHGEHQMKPIYGKFVIIKLSGFEEECSGATADLYRDGVLIESGPICNNGEGAIQCARDMLLGAGK